MKASPLIAGALFIGAYQGRCTVKAALRKNNEPRPMTTKGAHWFTNSPKKPQRKTEGARTKQTGRRKLGEANANPPNPAIVIRKRLGTT